MNKKTTRKKLLIEVQDLAKHYTMGSVVTKALKGINNTDFIVGVLYGKIDELSGHYKKIDKTHPVIIGKDLWHRITGFPNFYDGLVEELHKSILTIDTKDMINKGCLDLEEEIKSSPLFDF